MSSSNLYDVKQRITRIYVYFNFIPVQFVYLSLEAESIWS